MIISFSNLSFLIELCILFIIMNIIYFDIFVNYYDHITIETINFSIVQSSIFIFDKIFKTSEYKKKNCADSKIFIRRQLLFYYRNYPFNLAAILYQQFICIIFIMH